MIDSLISTDLAALAIEDRQRVPAFDAVLPQPRDKVRWPIKRWLAQAAPVAAPIVAVVAGAGVLAALDIHTFQESPQLAVVIVIAIVAMLHALGGRARAKPGKPVADVIAAVLITGSAAVFFLAVWHRHHATTCPFFDEGGVFFGPCTDHDAFTSPGFVAIVWAIVLIVARVLASRVRVDVARWGVAAKIVAVAVLLTWVSVNQFDDSWIGVAGFHAYKPPPNAALLTLHRAMARMFDWPHIGVELSPSQWDALAAGLAMLGFAATIAVACVRERARASRWLTFLEHPAVTPLAVVVATAALVYASAGDDPDITGRRAAIACVAAIIAYGGMLLRRRRREALS
ncbi:MAG: hypothetical protein ABI467_02090 [Kofleriaceae bacterium]